MAFSRSRKLANVGKAIDSGVSGDFLGLDDSGGIFKDVQWDNITGKPTVLDSAATIAIIDSAYVQARQTDVGIDSAQITNLIDSAYVQLRVGDAGLDSAAATGIVDSAYVAARVTAGLDSAGTLNLVDSDYISNRASASSGFEYFKYIATAGQTVFDSTDEYGNTLSYGTDNILVFYNGVLMLPTYDYTTSGGTTVTLNEGADSGIPVTIGKWAVGSSSSPAPTADWAGDRGIFAGGRNYSTSSYANEIQYLTISSAGNATDFGDLNTSEGNVTGAGAVTGDTSTRAVFAGGQLQSPPGRTSDIQYVTTTTTGNATDFGSLSATFGLNSGVSSGTRGVFQLGEDQYGTDVNRLEYITIATTGNSTDFGDTLAVLSRAGAAGDGTYGLFFGGREGVPPNEYGNNRIQYITIATTGNAADFGDMTVARSMNMACSDTTRAVTGGGYTGSVYSNVLDYVTIATTGNATDFGDFTSASSEGGAASNLTKGVFAISYDGTSFTNAVEQVTIQTTGNATDFGDMDVQYRTAGTSGNAS